MSGVYHDKYFETLERRLSLVCGELSDEDRAKLRERIWAMRKPIELTIENNYKDTWIDTNSEEILNIIYDKKPNISGYGVLFNHKPNIPGRVLDFLLKERKVKKNKMFDHLNDDDKTMYNKLDVEQKVLKVLANAYYGAFGQRSFHFFNPFLGPSVTYTGQHIILSAILGFESFMSDNFAFFTFDQLLKYVDNITQEFDAELTALDEKVTVEQVYARLSGKCNFELTEEQQMVLGGVLDDMPYTQLERLFLKNNLFFLLRNSTEVRDIFGECFSSEFLDPDHPPKEIAENVEALNEYFSYFVSYPYQWDDKYETAQNIKRKTVLISDTDSTFLNMDPAVKWYEETFGVKLDKVGKINVCNIMVYNVTKFIEKVFYQLTTNLNVKENMRSKINMKSEFNFSRIILTKNKKQYAGQIVLQEGKLLGKPKFAVVGLSIKKVGTPKIARKRFNDILEKDMLLADVIDPLVPFMKFMEFERDINNSLRAGESSFLKPARFTAERAYKKPFTQQTVRGVRLWNAIFPNRKIPNFTSVNMLKLRKYSLPKFEVDKDGEPVENVNKEVDILEFMEEIAKLNLAENILEGIAEFIQTPEIGNYGIDVIAIPKDIDQFPEELVPLADISSIINDNMKNGNILLESIGFKVIKSLKYDTVSNIIEI